MEVLGTQHNGFWSDRLGLGGGNAWRLWWGGERFRPRAAGIQPPPLDPADRLPGTFATDPIPLVWDNSRETRTPTQ